MTLNLIIAFIGVAFMVGLSGVVRKLWVRTSCCPHCLLLRVSTVSWDTL